MTTTISCSDDTKERFDDLRPEDTRSNDEFLTILLDYYENGEVARDSDIEDLVEELKNELSMTADPTVTPDVEGMMEKLERIESGVSTVEERTGRLDRRLSEMGGRQ